MTLKTKLACILFFLILSIITTVLPFLSFLQILPHSSPHFPWNSWPLFFTNCYWIYITHTYILNITCSIPIKLPAFMFSGLPAWPWTVNWCACLLGKTNFLASSFAQSLCIYYCHSLELSELKFNDQKMVYCLPSHPQNLENILYTVNRQLILNNECNSLFCGILLHSANIFILLLPSFYSCTIMLFSSFSFYKRQCQDGTMTLRHT